MTGSVVRRWEAVISRSDVSDWLATFKEKAFPSMRAVDGFRGIRFHFERNSDPCRVTVFTDWADMDAIRRYAGGAPEQAVVPDFMAPFLKSFDATATFHDELVLEAS